jgi:hypothetical protein
MCNNVTSAHAATNTLPRLTKRFRNVNPCHCGRAFKQHVSALTLFPGIYKDCPQCECNQTVTLSNIRRSSHGRKFVKLSLKKSGENIWM